MLRLSLTRLKEEQLSLACMGSFLDCYFRFGGVSSGAPGTFSLVDLFGYVPVILGCVFRVHSLGAFFWGIVDKLCLFGLGEVLVGRCW
jgi:hypothetical protein